jgi:hypothetical protein
MKQYKRIGHQKTYQAHQFCYEKIELSEDFPTDKPDEECFRELLERIEALAKVAYPWLFEEEIPTQKSWPVTSYKIPGGPFEVNGKTNEHVQPLSPKDNYLLEINQCTNTESLKALRFLAKTLKVEKDKQEVEEAYETKLAEITQKTTQNA